MDKTVGHLEFKVDLQNDATGLRYMVIYNRGHFDPLDGKFDLSKATSNSAERGLYLFIINERTSENIKLKLILSLYEENFLENELNFINIGDKHHSGMLLLFLDGYDHVKLRMLQADRNKVMQGEFLCYKL